MNIFELISILLMIGAVLLIYYVEIPRLRKTLNDRITLHLQSLVTLAQRTEKISYDLEAIKSARGTFSRRLDEFEGLLHSLGDKVDSDHITTLANNAMLGGVYLDSQRKDAEVRAGKKRKSGK